MSVLERVLRPLALVLALTAVAIGCWHWSAGDRSAALAPGAGLDALLTGLAVLLLEAALGWLLVLAVLVALEPWTGRDLTSSAGCPDRLRTLLATLCGVAVLGVLAVPADATPTPSPVAHRDPRVVPASAALDGLALPDRTTGGVAPSVGPPATTVVVRPGDCLWDLARAHLPAGAGDAEVARTARAVFLANRSVIGPDPDLIQPGTRLRLPSHPEEEHR